MAMTSKISFCPVPTPEVQEEILLASMTNTSDSNKSDTEEQGKRSFGPQPKFNSPNFDFSEGVRQTSFPYQHGGSEYV